MCSKRAAGVIPRGFCIVPYFALREVLDYVNNLRANALLRLCGLRAYVRRAAHMGMAVKRMVLGGLFGEHVKARAAQLAAFKGRKQCVLVHVVAAAGVYNYCAVLHLGDGIGVYQGLAVYAFYNAGIQIFDVKDPAKPTIAGYFVPRFPTEKELPSYTFGNSTFAVYTEYDRNIIWAFSVNGVYALSSPLLGKPNLGAPKKIWPERR